MNHDINMSYGREPYFYALLSSDPQLYFAFICYSHSSLLVMDKKEEGGAIFYGTLTSIIGAVAPISAKQI